MKFFSYDSKFSQIMRKICAGCYLNLLWFFCSIPVFTMGAATAALYDVALRMARDDEPPMTAQFFKAFRENFKQATQLWLILLGVGVLLGTDGYILYHLYRANTGAVGVLCTLGLALIIFAAVLYVIELIFVFPLTATFRNTNRAMLKNALLLGIRYLFCSILVFAIHFAMFFCVVAVFTPLIIFGEGLCAVISAPLLNRVLQTCMPREEEAE